MTQTKAELLQTRHQGDIRLGDADSTHYVGFKAPATVGTSLVWTLPGTDGSANQFLQTNASGVLSWGTADTSASMPLAGGTFTGDVTFDGATAGRDIVWDKSDNALEFADNAKATFGSSADLSIAHDGFTSNIVNTSGTLNIGVNNFVVKRQGLDETMLSGAANGAVTLYYDNAVKFATTATGVAITGAATVSGNLTVSGTTSTVDSVTLSVKDKNIEMGVVSSPSDTTADGGGITLKGASDKTINWVNSTDAWTFSEHINIAAGKKLGVGGANYGTSGHVLTSGGSGAAPSWAAIPAGGNSVDLVADGAITAGKPVIITAAGKAKQVGLTVTESTTQSSTPAVGTFGSPMSQNNTTNKFSSVTYSETTKTGCSFFQDNGSGQNQLLRGRAWNLNSNGVAVIYSGANTTVLSSGIYYQISSCWEATNDKFIIVAKKDSDEKTYMTWVSVTASGITASGNVTQIDGGANPKGGYPKCCDCGSGRVATATNVNWSGNNIYRPLVSMFVWNSSSSNYDTGQFEWVTSDGDSSNGAEDVDLTYHAAEGKLVVVWHTQANKVGCKIGTISGSGTSIDVSFGSEVEVASASELPKVVVDVNTGKVVVTYVNTSSNTIYSKVGTISGTSISFGSEVQVNAGSTVDANERGNFRPELIYLKNLKKVVYGWVTNVSSTYYTLTRTGTVSGTSISWANEFQHWTNGTGIRGLTMVELNTTGGNQVVIGGRNDANSDKGAFKTAQFSTGVANFTTNHKNFLGFAEDAISDGATGTIKLDGNVVGNQSGLTAGNTYHIEDDGQLDNNWDAHDVGLLALSSSSGLIRRYN